MIGKFIGGFFGYLITHSAIGLVIGILIGHFFDRGLSKTFRMHWAFGNQNTETQQIFFKTTFQVMGYIAKSDGSVSEDEIAQARAIMLELNLNEAQRQAAIQAFTEGKQPGFDLNIALKNLKNKCQQQRLLLQIFLEFQVRAATIRGKCDPGKEKIITHIYEQLGFPSTQNTSFNFDSFFRTFSEYSEQYQRSYQQSGGNPYKSALSIDRAYQILGISKSASDDEVKKTYRKLISQNHPDKLVAKGLPPEMIKLATEKTQQIQLAYEQICQTRGMK